MVAGIPDPKIRTSTVDAVLIFDEVGLRGPRQENMAMGKRATAYSPLSGNQIGMK